MTQTTSELGLTLPGGGSTGLNTPPDRADIDVLNNNFKLIDTRAAQVGGRSNRNFVYRGLAASLSGLTGMVENDQYKETDGDKRLWRYDGANWVSSESGLYLIRPTSANIVNGVLNADGSVSPNSGAKSISFNNVFTSRFRTYRLEFQYYTGDSNGSALKLRAGGVDYTTANYQYNVLACTTTVTASNTSAATQWGIAGNNSPGHNGYVDIMNPASNNGFSQKTIRGQDGYNTQQAFFNGFIAGVDASTFDGFTFTISNTALNPMDVSSKFKLYAYA